MPCNATTKTGKPCRFKTNENYCLAHARQGEGIVGDLFKAAKNLAKKAVAPITRRINAIREGPASKPTGRLDAFLNKTSGLKVVKLELGRKPILKPVKVAMDVLSGGRFSKKQKELNYDEVYHNFTLFTLSDGSRWKIEKNHVVEFFPATEADFKGEVWEIPLQNRDLTMRGMVDTASKGDAAAFWKYRAGSNNCQQFTRQIIEKNGLLPDVAEPHHEVQDAKALADSLPESTHHLPNFVTDLAAVGDRILHGEGVQLAKKRAIRAMLFQH